MIDAHVHVACADTKRYPRDPTPGRGREWWHEHGDAGEALATVRSAGIGRVVIVHAGGLYGTDCTCAAAVAAEHRDMCALVGQIDGASDDAAASLRVVTGMGATGARVVATREPGWLGDGRGRAVWRAAADEGVTLCLTVRPESIPTVAHLCAESPDATVVLDHGAFVHLGGPGAEAQLLTLADVPSASVKLTTHNLVIDAPAAWLRRMVDAFGASRLCWGSDFPQVEGHTYPELVQLAREATAELDDAERSAFLVETSERLWWR